VFLKQLDKVRAVYPFAEVHQAERGLPSRPHVPRVTGSALIRCMDSWLVA
jgi:hypothetical protein